MEQNESAYNPHNRFYENIYPEIDECVAVKIINIDEMGAYVKLVEYGNIDALILLSEISRKRLRSVNKNMTVGHIDYAKVLRVDKDKGYIDLSKRSVEQNEREHCIDKFAKSKTINTILKSVSLKTNIPVFDLNTFVVWPYLHDNPFNTIEGITDTSVSYFDTNEGLRDILKIVTKKHYMTDTKIKYSSIIEIMSFNHGIEAIKIALLAGKAIGLEQDPNNFTIRYVKSPQYIIITESTNATESKKLLLNVIDTIDNTIKSFGGSLNVVVAPNIHSDKIESDSESESESELESDDCSAKVIDNFNDSEGD
jgi:translation initiation factor 2 subunit 1